MFKLIGVLLCLAFVSAWPERIVERYEPDFGATAFDDYEEPNVDPGLLEAEPETFVVDEIEEGPDGLGGLGEEGDIVVDGGEEAPDMIVIDRSPQNPLMTYGYNQRRRNPFESIFRFGNMMPDSHRSNRDELESVLGDSYNQVYGRPFRPSRPSRPSFNDIVFGDFMRPMGTRPMGARPMRPETRPMMSRFPTFHFRIGSQRPAVFQMPNVFNFGSQFPTEEEPELFDESETGMLDPAGNDDGPVGNDDVPTRHNNPFFHHFFRPSISFGGFDSSFGNFPSLPDNYRNSTSTVKDVNGTKFRVNETISKKSGDNFNTIFHFKVIHIDPENEREQEEVTTLPPSEEEVTTLPPLEEETTIGEETHFGVDYEGFVLNPVPEDNLNEVTVKKEIPRDEPSPDYTGAAPKVGNEILSSFDIDQSENEIFDNEGQDQANSKNIYQDLNPKTENHSISHHARKRRSAESGTGRIPENATVKPVLRPNKLSKKRKVFLVRVKPRRNHNRKPRPNPNLKPKPSRLTIKPMQTGRNRTNPLYLVNFVPVRNRHRNRPLGHATIRRNHHRRKRPTTVVRRVTINKPDNPKLSPDFKPSPRDNLRNNIHSNSDYHNSDNSDHHNPNNNHNSDRYSTNYHNSGNKNKIPDHFTIRNDNHIGSSEDKSYEILPGVNPPDLTGDTRVNRILGTNNQQGYTVVEPAAEVFDLSLVLKEQDGFNERNQN